MNRVGKILLLIAGVSVLAAGLFRFILGDGHISIATCMGVALVCFVVAAITNLSLLKEFFMMRTTKHGMNMGVLIVFAIIAVVAANYMAVRHNKKWDMTEEGVNSISPQSKKVLTQIDSDLKVRFFYRGGAEGVDVAKRNFKGMVSLFTDENSRVSLEFIDSGKRPGLASEYGITKAAATIFVDYKGKRNTVESLDEQGLATAIIKVSREKNKKVLLLTGHGELSAENTNVDGISELSNSLVSSGYDVETRSLLDTGKVGEGIDLVMILGPKTSYLDRELQALREYVKSGGRLFIAADPGMKHGLAQIIGELGVDFRNDFVLDQLGQMLGVSAATAMGRSFGSTEITKGFEGRMTMFHLASSLKKKEDVDAKTEAIVSAVETSFTTDKISQGQVEVKTDRRGPHAIGFVTSGKLKDSENEYSAVIFGDSDFLSNQLIFQQMNRDLALNSVSHLMRESNLISIRPKQLKSALLTMTQTQFWLFLCGVIIPVPLALFGFAGGTWYRRRNA